MTKEHNGCANCKYVANAMWEEPCNRCKCNVAEVTDRYEPQTNADRIRNMTDEELAGFLIGVSNNYETITACDEKCDACANDIDGCIELCRLWLRKEVEE